jgi:hypothetical protein
MWHSLWLINLKTSTLICKFQTLYGRIRAVLNDAGLEGDLCETLWADSALTATFYENIIVNNDSKKDSTSLMFNKTSKRPRKLRKFGEMCVITTIDKIQSKLADKGTTCMFVGYNVDHTSGVYRFLNPKTEHIIKSRDVAWLGKSLGTWKGSQDEVEINRIDDSDNEKEIQRRSMALDKVNTVDKYKLDKAKKAVSKLKSWFNLDPERFIENNDPGRELIVEKANIALNLIAKVKEPDSFD